MADFFLFASINGLQGRAAARTGSVFYFCKYKAGAVHQDQVNLPFAAAEILFQKPQPFTLKKGSRCIFITAACFSFIQSASSATKFLIKLLLWIGQGPSSFKA